MQWQTAVQLEARSGATVEYEVPLSFIGKPEPVRAAVADILSLLSLSPFSFFLFSTNTNSHTTQLKPGLTNELLGSISPFYSSPKDKIHE